MPKAKPVEKVRLTENQLKVIRDKYLRDAPSVEAWLEGVARNVALGELLAHPDAEAWGLFEGVERRAAAAPSAGPAPASRAILFHSGQDLDARSANFARLLANLEKA